MKILLQFQQSLHEHCVCVKFYECLDSSNYCHSQETELFPHLTIFPLTMLSFNSYTLSRLWSMAIMTFLHHDRFTTLGMFYKRDRTVYIDSGSFHQATQEIHPRLLHVSIIWPFLYWVRFLAWMFHNCFSTHLLKDVWVVFGLGLLEIQLL